jgi:hypothetical protein
MLLAVTLVQVLFGTLLLSVIPIGLYLVVHAAIKGGRPQDR